MPATIPKNLVQTAVRLIKSAKQAVALTGAGISTPSGIPDFRSRGSGLWELFDPMQVASLTAFRYSPDKFYEWIQPLAKKMIQAKPNPAHHALARLESAGRLSGIITQNIDGLHHKAGSQMVLEVHGHIREATCVSCYRPHPTDELLNQFATSGEIPKCPICGGILKPNAVLYEEQLPYDVFRRAIELMAGSDLILIAGSSLEVTPVSTLPIEPLNAGAQLIIVNDEPTYLDERADVIFRQDVAIVLPQLATEVLGEEE